MKRIISLATVLFLVAMLLMVGCSGSSTSTLIVKEMVFQDIDALPIAVTLEDSKGGTVTFSEDPSSWFTNASLVATLHGVGCEMGSNEQGQMVLADGGYITFIFEVNDMEYTVDVGNGTTFEVEPDGEGYAVVLDGIWRPGGIESMLLPNSGNLYSEPTNL